MATRSHTADYLCSPNDGIRGTKLPSKGQVLSFFLHLHLNNKKTVRDSATIVVNCVTNFWDLAKIPIIRKDTVILKVEKLYKHYQSIKRGKSRRSAPQKQKESEFVAELPNLFDIASINALAVMKNQEDREFLLAQREPGRRGTMGAADHKLAAMQKRSQKRQLLQEERKSRWEQEAIATSSTVALHSSSSGDDRESEDDESATSRGEAGFPKRRRATKNVVSPQLSMALDRTKVTDRSAAYVLTETVRSIGQDPKEYNINRTSIQRLRNLHRKSLAGTLKAAFQADCPLVVHWDGKLLRDLTTKEHVDRLPVIVTGNGVLQLLKVAKLPNGTGLQQAKAVVEALDDWDLKQKVVAMSFDTTSSNTGRKQGACVMIEQELETDLLHLACRHHILELLVQTAFTTLMGSTAGPEVLMFKRFQSQWDFLDKNNFTTIATTELAETVVNPDVVTWAEKSLKERKDLRDDYREFIELSLIFMGVTPPRGIHFMAPGPMHHARWMSKVLYSVKVWMFHQQFKLTDKENNNLLQMCIFSVKIYLKAWIEAPLSAAAPNNDLKLFKSIQSYASINSAVSKAVLSKFCSHLWYLSEELVALAFFDVSVSANTKRLMVKATKERSETEDAPKRQVINPATSDKLELPDLVTRGSLSLFQKLGISSKFMEKDPDTWQHCDDYCEALKVVNALTVTNDYAE